MHRAHTRSHSLTQKFTQCFSHIATDGRRRSHTREPGAKRGKEMEKEKPVDGNEREEATKERKKKKSKNTNNHVES